MAGLAETARRLGRVYGLLTGAFVLFLVVITMLAQFGLPERVIAVFVVMITVLTYAGIGLIARTLSLSGFYLADRGVPAGFNGMATASALLGLPFVGLAGAFLADRLLGLAVGAGLLCGLVLLAIVVAPYYRKSGGVTVPDYLAVRYGNPLVRVLATVLVFVAMLPVLAATLRLAADVAGSVLHLSPTAAVTAVLVVVLLTSLLGGMRATTFAGGAQAIVVLLAMLVPAILISLEEYGFPIPQVTLGYAIAENAAEGPIAVLAGHALPVAGLDGFNMLALALALAAGVASFPQLVTRSGVAAGPGEARLAAAWALVVTGIVIATAPALAAFVRVAILRDVTGVELADIPPWVFEAGRTGSMLVCGEAPVSAAAIGTACGAGTVINGLSPTDIAIGADLVTLGFADITGLPYVLTALIAAGAIAAALGTAAAVLTTTAASLGNDLLSRLFARRASASRRLIVTRAVLIAVAALAAWIALRRPEEAFAYAVAAPSIAAASFFPALTLGVFWRRTTFLGALLGMAAGGGATIAYVVLTISGGLPPAPITGLTEAGVSAAASGAIGVPLGFVVAVAVSLLGKAPGPARRAVTDAIRRPSPDPILEDHAT